MSADPLRALVRRFMRNDSRLDRAPEAALVALARKAENAALERFAKKTTHPDAALLARFLKTKAPRKRGGAA